MEAPPTGHGPERLARITASNRSLISKSSLTIGSRVVSKVTQLLWLVVAARVLSVDAYAQYGYVVSIALTFCVLGDAGVGTIVGREIASGGMDPRRAFWSAVPLVAVIGSAVTLLFCAFLAISSGPGVTVASVAAGGAFILGNRAFDLSATALRSLGRIGFEANLQLANAALFVALATAVAVSGGGVALVLATLAAKEVASALVAGVAIRPDIGRYVAVPLRSTMGLLRSGLFVSLASFALSVCTRIPLVVLGNAGTSAEVAYYTTAVRFADTALTLSITVGYGLLPGLANIQAGDPVRALRLIWRTLGLLAAAAVVVSVPVVALRRPLAEVVFGSDFAPAAAPIGILMGGLVVLAVTGVAWFALLAFEHERAVFAASILGIVAALAASLAVAQTPSGAAVAYLVGVGAIAVWLVAALAASGPAPRSVAEHDREMAATGPIATPD